ncbi:Glycylpeptide N-tetradecanoyltransferase [Dissostichus eleginoides]|uniref:Glycylpeptide N-tetradecanoyltransferase n=1 Tax=Dissostichus eleginoides TaxID=100907 RepID=A0AAD9FM93_DISEL|nr:Glycylpeptide N-tetradecanoyltransferase [Dissostichus eleginoides]
MAFIGLTLLPGSEKNWDVSVRELFGSPSHNPIYKATMAVGRFDDIRRVLRFDDKRTRAIRLEQIIWQPSATYGTCSWSTADNDSSPVIVLLWTNSLCHSGGGASSNSTCQKSPPSTA